LNLLILFITLEFCEQIELVATYIMFVVF